MAQAAPIAIGATPTIVITDRVEPRTLTVAPGETVTVENRDDARHRLRSQGGAAEFDVDLDPGEVGSITLTSPGTYPYVDDRDRENTSYHGTIVVVEAPATSAPPGASPAPGGAAPTGATVTMAGRRFSPATVTIAVGGSVTFVNDDDARHTATGDGFDTGVLQPGSRSVRSFPRAGTFGYLCLIHPDMTGTVQVVDATGTAPTTAPHPRTPAPAPAPTPAAGGGAAGGAALVRLVDFAMLPRVLDVNAGTRVTFRNDGAALHTATAADRSFDSGFLSPGRQYARVFSTPGTYAFLCALHPQMTGTVRVGGGDQAPAPTPAPASPGAPAGSPPADPSLGPSAPGSATVEILDAAFRPASLAVPAGTSVTWRNVSALPHSATSAGRFDSGVLSPGGVYTLAMDTPGSYPYACIVHPDMQAVIEVLAPGSGLQGVVPAATGSTAPQPHSSPPSSVEAWSPAQAEPPDPLRILIVLVLPAVSVGLFLLVVRGVARR